MKKIILIFLALASIARTEAQDTIKVDGITSGINFIAPFSDNSQDNYFYVDSTLPGNLWERGTPVKTFFSGTSWDPGAMVTDSVNPYPVNNTSVFTFQVQRQQWGTLLVSFESEFNTDTLNDGGMVEFSLDGTTWYNAGPNGSASSLTWSSTGMYGTSNIVSSLGQPGFSGNSSGTFSEIYFISPADTLNVTFRFTFASDNIQITPKDGWMIDHLNVESITENVAEYKKTHLISLFPNPAVNELSFSTRQKFQKPFEIGIYDQLGQLYTTQLVTEKDKIDISGLAPGIYFCTFKNEGLFENKKIVVTK